ncbi:MAG TPA: carbonic anhydrase family protein [Candidatus Acidoferrales bacterium]|nr:carbonic anhydrase family protein [Candidatus Acidoferrales bacterium]
MRKLTIVLGTLFIIAAFPFASPRAQWKTAWSYEGPRGPEHWAELDPAYAACDGKAQSPIDIRSAKKVALPPLRFEFKSGPLNIINNGFTAVRVDYPAGNGNLMLVGGERYELTQFHFHHPSEEQIDGKPAAMVLHLMFKSSDGKVAGVAVLLNEGNVNATVEKLWKYMPQTAGKLHLIPGVEINPAALLPRNTSYYMYMGSVTAPPCTEGVKWFVLKIRMTASAEEIAAFAKLYPQDVRPPQPLNGRVVLESQ